MSLKVGTNTVVSSNKRADVESLFLSSYTYAQLRSGSSVYGTSIGDIAYCSDCRNGEGLVVVWNGTDWFREVATGGHVVDGEDGYLYHVFTEPGNFEVLSSIETDYVIISGGGGGGPSLEPTTGGYPIAGGGGGGGEFKFRNNRQLTTGSYAVVVGKGGGNWTPIAGTPIAQRRTGQPSSFNGQVCEGGGFGGSFRGQTQAGPGACGGGAVGSNSNNAGIGRAGFPGGGRFPNSPGGSTTGGMSGGGGGGLTSGGQPGNGQPSGVAKGGGNGGDGQSLQAKWDFSNASANSGDSEIMLAYMPSTQVCGGGGGGAFNLKYPQQSPLHNGGNGFSCEAGGYGGSGGGGIGGGRCNPSYPNNLLPNPIQSVPVSQRNQGGWPKNALPGTSRGAGGGGAAAGTSSFYPEMNGQGGNGGDGIVTIRYPNPGNVVIQ